MVGKRFEVIFGCARCATTRDRVELLSFGIPPIHSHCIDYSVAVGAFTFGIAFA
jgi:hypothetical protein